MDVCKIKAEKGKKTLNRRAIARRWRDGKEKPCVGGVIGNGSAQR